MPVRSLNSSVFKWPNHREVDHAVRGWARAAIERNSAIVGIGYFGSYARGDWGVGSDVDLVAVVTTAEEPFERRSMAWDLSQLPVPAQLLAYTDDEWQALQRQGGRFARVLANETVWVFGEVV